MTHAAAARASRPAARSSTWPSTSTRCDELLALRDRIRSRGITVLGPIHHGICDSIYFAGPEDLSLEIATSERRSTAAPGSTPRSWRSRASPTEELARYRGPAPYHDRGGALPQPPLDKGKPYMRGWPPGIYERLLELSDDEFSERTSETEPPVRL